MAGVVMVGDLDSNAGDHLVEHDAERPDVGPLVDRLALGLFRRHVGRRAEDHAHLGHGGRGDRR